MNVHELFTELSRQDRTAKVTIKNGKIQVGGKVLKTNAADATDEDREKVAEGGNDLEGEAGSDDKEHSA